jgi:hypothetical protein
MPRRGLGTLTSLGNLGTLKSIRSAVIPAPLRPPPVPEAPGRPLAELGSIVIRARGPELLHLGRKRKMVTVPIKPTDFPGSIPEWVWYYVSCRKLSPKQNPLAPPYIGDWEGSWAFADPIGATQAKRLVGQTTPDFVYFTPQGQIVVRIEGFYWHTAAPPSQQARDRAMAAHLTRFGSRVERVEDHEYMDDATGAKAGGLLGEILAGRRRIGAISGGTAVPPRYAQFT